MQEAKLLFHGTAAISIWTSYQRARMLRQAERRDPAAFKSYLKDTETEQLYAAHGPAYPFQNFRRVCLADFFSTAADFTEWAKTETEVDNSIYISFTNTSSRHIYLDKNEFMVCSLPEFSAITQVRRYAYQDHYQLLQGLAGTEIPYRTPGAVLVVDEDYLLRHELMVGNFGHREGEHDFESNYLPWRAIKGIAMIDHYEWPVRISGFIARSPRIRSDFYKELEYQRLNYKSIDWAGSALKDNK